MEFEITSELFNRGVMSGVASPNGLLIHARCNEFHALDLTEIILIPKLKSLSADVQVRS